MSTIKPLDIYIGQTKVFPDVNLDVLNSPIIGSSVISSLNDSANYILTQHNANISNLSNLANKSIIVPYVDDTDSSAFHTNSYSNDNYWNFNNHDENVNVLDIMFDIDAKWLYNKIANYDGQTFYKFNGTSISFKQGSKLAPRTFKYSSQISSKEGQVAVINNFCTHMFDESRGLVSISNLDLTESTFFDTTEALNPYDLSEAVTESTPYDPKVYDAYSFMFQNCSSLTTLGVTWPTYLYGESFDRMFYGCSNLPESQIPEFKFRPTNLTWESTLHDWVTFAEAFMYCTNVTSTHIDSDTWQYVKNIERAWCDSGLKQIDIPATATKLIRCNGLLGEPTAVRDEEHQKDDYSAWKYIIRTTAPMTAVLNNVEYADCMLFNFWDHDNIQDFIDTFGGIYVPDAQLQDWKTYISGLNAPNIAANCVFGLSEL